MPENPWIDPRPFVIGPDDARASFVLVHGFTGAPAEMRLLGEALAERGFRAHGPLLPGHGVDEAALAAATLEDWLGAVDDAVSWARELSDRVVLVGLSMGGLLTTIIAARRNSVDAIGLLAPAFRVDNPLFRLVGLGRFILRSMPAPNLPNAGLASPDGWKQLWHYDQRPLDAVWQLRQLQKQAWRSLADVEVPALVVQGRRDQTLDPEGAQEAFDRLGSASKELLWLERSGHCLTVDLELERVVDALVAHCG